MRSDQLNLIAEELIPSLFEYSFALTGDKQLATDLLLDGYTVFLVRENKFLGKQELKRDEQKNRRVIKKFIYKELIRDIYDLATKRMAQIKAKNSFRAEHTSFFQLDMLQRAVVFLKEVKGFLVEDIQEVFDLPRHRTLEVFYNARYKLIQDIESLYREEVAYGH